MPLEPGTRLGPYEILSAINAGNSGEVYKASDTRLNRSVAIKVLPAEFAPDAERRDRIKRDSQTLASLNHPNICALYDVGTQEGVDYLVTECLEGETLAQRLTKGALEIEEALKIGMAIADALDKAHRRGVTHRGLNPSAVMLTSNGVKLLDFGFSQTNSSAVAPGSFTSMPTRTAAAGLTSVPAYAAPYLAPELWDGAEADARADIFAAGAILYEMITGKPAFEGKTPALLIAAIQTIDPEPVSKLQPLASSALDYVLKRCFAKNPKQRLQTAWDLLSQLQWITEGGSQVGVPAVASVRRKKREQLLWAALALGLLAALLLAFPAYRYFKGAPETEVMRFVLPPLGSAGAGGPPVSISPDGRWIVRSTGNPNRGLDGISMSSSTRQILVTQNIVTQPFWSPDSGTIAFFEEGMLRKAEVSGGPTRNICEAAGAVGGGTWNRAGIIVFSIKGLLNRVAAAGGPATPILPLDASRQETEQVSPSFLPDGKHFLYLSLSSQPANAGIYVGALDSKETRRLIAADSRGIYAPPGYILFSRADAVYAQPFDANKLAIAGEPVRVADGVSNVSVGTVVNTNASISRNAAFAVSETGILTYRSGTNNSTPQTSGVADRTLTWFDRTGARTTLLGGPGAYAGLDLSPDGKQVAVHVHEAQGGDSWYFDSAQARMQRLTFDASQHNGMPIWSPDGTKIAFGSRRNGKWGIYIKPVDGTAKEELLTESEMPKMPMSWSPDGKVLVYWSNSPTTRGDIWMVPVSGDHKPAPFLQTQSDELNPQISADGKWLAYTSNETGRPEIFIKPFPEGPGQWQITTDGGVWPRWRRDGKELFFLAAPNVIAVDIHVMGASIQPGVPHILFGINNPSPNLPDYSFHPYAVSPDGQRFLIPQAGGGAASASGDLADQMIAAADQSGAAAGNANGITVIMNWPQLAKRK
jgi:Tol biopolymer transport system component